MNKLETKINNGYFFGCIRYKDVYEIYLMPIAWWILNYPKYDPSYNPNNWENVFRDGIYTVSDDMIDSYIKSIEIDKLDLTSLKSQIYDEIKEDVAVSFFVDFDTKLFVNGFYEIEMEEYLPSDKWKGISDDPNLFLPEYLKEYFS